MMWVENDLTALAGGTPAAIDETPLVGYSQGDGSQHVDFIDGSGHVRELYRSPDPAAQWVDNDLTRLAGGTPAMVNLGLVGYSQGDGSQHVNFIDGSGHVHELYRSPDPAAQWVDNDLTGLPVEPRLPSQDSTSTRRATAASTSISLTAAGTSTSCTGTRVRRPSGSTTT